ncbi:MAG TPA: hypothetical protein VI542_06060 [Candidatus Tectomicrobia bacterium]
MHAFTIHYHTWNRTARRMSGRQCATVHARSCWGALRAWWRIQRQYRSLVEVLDIRPVHTEACLEWTPTSYIYACAHA